MNDLVGRVYHRFEAAMKADYDAAKAELEIQFHISEASHRKKLRDLTKSPDEAWTMFAQRHNYLQEKWLDAYPTRKDVLQAYGKETILETMPRSLATRVRERKPTTTKEAAEIADNIVFTRDAEADLRKPEGTPLFLVRIRTCMLQILILMVRMYNKYKL